MNSLLHEPLIPDESYLYSCRNEKVNLSDFELKGKVKSVNTEFLKPYYNYNYRGNIYSYILNFDEAALLDTRITKQSEDRRAMFVEKKYIYYSGNRIKTILERNCVECNNYSLYEYNYTKSGYLKSASSYDIENEKKQLFTAIQYTIGSANNKITISQKGEGVDYSLNRRGGTYSKDICFFFLDSVKNVIEVIPSRWGYEHLKYNYDKAGRIISYECHRCNIHMHNEHTMFEYNINGNICYKHTSYIHITQRDNFFIDNVNFFEYDTKNLLINEYSIHSSTPYNFSEFYIDTLKSSQLSTDSQKLTTKHGTEELFSTLKSKFTNANLIYRYEYEFDIHDNWVERRQYDKDCNLINVIKRSITYF